MVWAVRRCLRYGDVSAPKLDFSRTIERVLAVVIQRSSSAQTATLIADLIGAEPVRRETAIARLAIAGERAVDRLLAALADATAQDRADVAAVILRTLEQIGSPRTVPAALARLSDANDGVAVAAAGALRPHLLRGDDDDVATRVLEGLTALALATDRSDPPRLAALEALGEMDTEALQPIRDRLRGDPSARVRRMAGWADDEETPVNAAAHLEAAARGELPEEADTLRSLLTQAGATVALSVLHELVMTLRTKERVVADASSAPDAAMPWTAARGATHQVLAERQSRLAVFDLRDTFERATSRLPLGFVAAITTVGDASCLPALAAAWQQVEDGWMRDHIAAAFQAIMVREGLTRRHAAVRKALERGAGAKGLLPARS
jgi:HEAT repeat protein